jgi:hypothetical protein
MNSKQHQNLADLVVEKFNGGKECPSCKNSKSWLVECVVEMREYHEGLSLGGAYIVPLVMLTCKGCAFVLFYNAIHFGVVNKRTGKFEGI